MHNTEAVDAYIVLEDTGTNMGDNYAKHLSGSLNASHKKTQSSQIRTLSDTERSLDIGNAGTKDSGSNIDVRDGRSDLNLDMDGANVRMIEVTVTEDMGDKQGQDTLGSLREVQGEPPSRWQVTEENVLQLSSKWPWTCP